MLFVNGVLVAKEEALRVMQVRAAPPRAMGVSCECERCVCLRVQVKRELHIGEYADGQYGFGGRIANVMVLNVVITPDQLQHAMSVRCARAAAGARTPLGRLQVTSLAGLDVIIGKASDRLLAGAWVHHRAHARCTDAGASSSHRPEAGWQRERHVALEAAGACAAAEWCSPRLRPLGWCGVGDGGARADEGESRRAAGDARDRGRASRPPSRPPGKDG